MSDVALRRKSVRRPVTPKLAAWVLVAAIALYVAYRVRVTPRSEDLAVYRATGAAVLHGGRIYADLHLFDHLLATYPPFAALLFAPLSGVPLAGLQYLVLVLNVALLLVIAWLTTRLLGVPPARRSSLALLAAAAGMLCEPVVSTLDLGQIDLAIVALVLIDLVQDDSSKLRGVGIGLATAVKLTPGLFIVYLLVTRRFRNAATAVVAAATATAVGGIALPGPSREYWTKLIFDVRRVGLVGRPDNQSLRGLLARVLQRPDAATAGTGTAIVVGVCGLAVAWLAYRRLGELWGAMACAFTALLASPISWTHHWVWCVPAAMLLWVQGGRWVVAAAVFWTYAVRLPRNPYTRIVHHSPGGILVSGAYVYFGVLFVALAAYRAWRRPAGHPRDVASGSAHDPLIARLV